MGVPMGAPYFQVREILERHQTAVFSSNFQLYGDFSARVMALVNQRFPRTEVYSIDEIFIDLTGMPEIEKQVRELQQHIAQALGIPTSLGIAATKTLAKVANQRAKKYADYGNVCFLTDPVAIDEALQSLRVEELWGIGHRMSKRLAELGIFTAYQLKQQNPKWIRRLFTVMGERWVHELQGTSCLTLETQEKPRQSIQVTRSFATRLSTYAELEPIVASHATRLARQMRRQGLKTRHVWVYLRSRLLDAPRTTTMVTTPLPINEDGAVIRAALQGLKAIFRPGILYDKAGVMGLDLVSAERVQGDFFCQEELQTDPKQQRVMQVMDALNAKYGRGTIYMAVCGRQFKWPDRKQHHSPCYTTDWQDLALAR